MDSGATNNFLSQRFADRGALETVKGNGHVVFADGRVTEHVARLSKPANLKVGGHTERIQFTVAALQNGV